MLRYLVGRVEQMKNELIVNIIEGVIFEGKQSPQQVVVARDRYVDGLGGHSQKPYSFLVPLRNVTPYESALKGAVCG